MTVESTTNRAQYGTNGTTGPWTVPWQFYQKSDVLVIYTDADGNETELADADYSVTGVGNEAGGTVSTTTAYASGGYITLLMNFEALQETDYTETDSFPAETHERALDLLTRLVQQLKEVTNRSLVFSPSDTSGSTLPAAAARASKLLAFDSLGRVAVSIPDSGSAADVLLQLASSASNTLGSALVARNPALSYATGTVGAALAGEVTSSEYSTLAAALAAAAGGRLRVVGANAITATLVPANNTTIIIEAGASITGNVADMILIDCSSKSNVTILGPGKIQNTATGTGSGGGTIGLVSFESATDCLIEGVQLIGQTWAGVLLRNSVRCRVIKNKITGAIGTLQDSADVMLYEETTSCEVIGNHCNSGSHTGIMLQDPYADLFPQANHIIGNWCNGHTAYGIAAYMPGTSGQGDTNNLIAYNYISGTLGSYTTNRDSGSGIYVVGTWAGGTQVIGNLVRNSCSQTLTRALAPAGIGINGIAAGTTRPVISGNTVSDNIQGDGINVSSCPGGAVLSGNAVTIPAGNDSSGVGGATLLGSGIRIEASNKVEVSGGDATVLGQGSGVFIYANGVSMSDIGVVGGRYESATGATIRVARSLSYLISSLRLDGVGARNTGSSNYAFSLTGVTGGAVSNCMGYATAFEALRLTDCTATFVSGGAMTSGANPSISTSGACTGSSISSVYFGAAAANINNAATGCRIEWYGATAAPSAGTWAVGDRAIRVPVVGQPKAWSCTTAGTPGTFTSEGNL